MISKLPVRQVILEHVPRCLRKFSKLPVRQVIEARGGSATE